MYVLGRWSVAVATGWSVGGYSAMGQDDGLDIKYLKCYVERDPIGGERVWCVMKIEVNYRVLQPDFVDFKTDYAYMKHVLRHAFDYVKRIKKRELQLSLDELKPKIIRVINNH